MAHIEERRHKNGKVRYRVQWRDARTGERESATFSEDLDAKQFDIDLERNGRRFPDQLWERGTGQRRPQSSGETVPLLMSFADAMERYIDQLDSSAVQSSSRKGYRGQVRVLLAWECCHPNFPGRSYRPFDRPVAAITEDDIKHWAKMFPRAEKTKANYLYALLAPAFTWMVRRKILTETPIYKIRLNRQAIRNKRIRHLTEAQWHLLHSLAPDDMKDLLQVAVGTGLRWSELAGLWFNQVDLERGTLTVDKAWKAKGAEGDWQLDPSYVALKKRGLLKDKHERLRGFYLGAPKSMASERTFDLPEEVLPALARSMARKAPDDFIFTDDDGEALHNVEFYNYRFEPLVQEAIDQGLGIRPTLHDLRHTFAVWALSAPGVTVNEVSAKLGHAATQTTLDRYGGYMAHNSAATRNAINNVLRSAGRPVYPLATLVEETDEGDMDDEAYEYI